MAEHTMDVTDRVGEWCAVLETLAERETHEWRRNKLSEIAAFLRSHRYSAARIEALEEALESISGFCLLYEAGNLGGAETVRRIHGVTDRTLLSTGKGESHER